MLGGWLVMDLLSLPGCGLLQDRGCPSLVSSTPTVLPGRRHVFNKGLFRNGRQSEAKEPARGRDADRRGGLLPLSPVHLPSPRKAGPSSVTVFCDNVARDLIKH